MIFGRVDARHVGVGEEGEIPDAMNDAVPCPQCDYDLRGQTEARCPECGAVFGSLTALERASAEARRVYRRVLRWRQWIAWGIAVSVVWVVAGLPMVRAYVLEPAGLETAALWGLAVGLAGLLVASGAAMVLLAAVLRWRFSGRIGRREREELNGSIPLLVIFALPAGLAGVGLVVGV